MGIVRRGSVLGAAAAALLAGALAWGGATGARGAGTTTLAAPSTRRSHGADLVLRPQVRAEGFFETATPLRPPTERYCATVFGILCYGPTQLQTNYDEQPLFREGLDGRGETIVIVDSYGAPTIRRDLTVFDRSYGLPAPPKFDIMKFGNVPAFTPTAPTATGWAYETTLDVEWSHSIAPGANILLVETATSENEGNAGFPTIVNAENYVIDHHMGDVISQSFAAAEATFGSPATIVALRSAYENAYKSGITVVSASGDTGAAQARTVTKRTLTKTNYFPFRDIGWPASDPLVTAVGGTQLTLDTAGHPIAPVRAWNDTAEFGRPLSSTGGVSTVFTRPSFQDGVAGVVGNRRGVPDVSMSASLSGAVEVYISGISLGAGWLSICGTSEATPEFAGIVAIADQLNGHRPLGLIDPALYAMEAAHDPGIVPVTIGTNTVFFTTKGKTRLIPGYDAGPGYNLVTGIGTVNAPTFVRELVTTVHRVGTAVSYGISSAFLPHTT